MSETFNESYRMVEAFDVWWEAANISRNKSDAVERAFAAGWEASAVSYRLLNQRSNYD